MTQSCANLERHPNSSAQTIFDAIIVGGGVIGLATALGMAKQDFLLAVVDSGSLTVDLEKPCRRVFAVNAASQRLLTTLGVWPILEPKRLSPYQHMLIWDFATGRRIEFDSRLIASDKLGVIVEESVLRAGLLQALAADANVHFFPEQRVVNLREQEGLRLLQSDQQSWLGRMLLAADGAHSPCRELLKVPLTTWPYEQSALVATVTTELPHQRTAYQVFNPEGPLAFLPLADAHQCSIVWSTTAARAKELMALPDASFHHELSAAFADKLGKVTWSSERHCFPLVMRNAQQYVGNNWLLLGDAAHTIHPLAGLGLNLGLADVAAWLALLENNPGQVPTKRQLKTYQRQRQSAVWQIIVLMQTLKMLFASTFAPVRLLRGVGLACCDHLPLLKRLFIDCAEG